MASPKPGKNPETQSLVISYLQLRRAIGVMGFSFPFILFLGAYFIGGYPMQKSISAYYHTNMRDVFVGVLFVLAVFLFSYKGYGKVDNIIGFLGSVFALGTAIFPCAQGIPPLHVRETPEVLHLVFAGLFFGVLVVFSLFLFTRSHPQETPTRGKKLRNRVYIICGCVMIISILLAFAFIYFNLHKTSLARLQPVFWLETTALWAFGVSWFVKGRTIIRDVQVNG